MWKMANFRRKRKGFALIFVVLIAVAMIIPVMILASNAVSRRKVVTGEAVSDRSLTVADATVDRMLNKINTFPFTFTTPTITDESGNLDEATKDAQDYLVSYYLCQLNGGVPDPNNPVTSYDHIIQYVSTYLYNLNTQEYYAVWDSTPSADFPNGHIANVSDVGPDGDIKNNTLKNLNTGALLNGGMEANFPNYKTDNLWIEIDANVRYGEDENGNPLPDTWLIRNTAYLLSKPNIKRTTKATASRGTPSVESDQLANGSWFTHDTTTTTIPGHSFADYSGLYHTTVYFGRSETTTGPIRSDADLYMGGWAQDPVFATGTVYDEAIDDYNGNHDGCFGSNQNDLNEAKNNGYATDGYQAAVWANGDLSLKGSSPVRDSTDSNGGLQDKSLPDYYVNGDATVVFSVVTDADGNKVGKVTINGTTYDMPSNGAIYVEGTATVSGTVKGQCSVGASKITIGGNIVYNTPPRLDRNQPIPSDPDLLGLISYGNITIPASTFNANHHLQIDAAMISVSGSFGVDSDVPWHPEDASGTYEAWWNGCQALYSTDNAPAFSWHGSTEGYDIQHTNYDWNLRDYGVPPFYPVTSTTGEHTDTIDHWPAVDQNSSLYKDVLSKIKKDDPNEDDPQLTPITDTSDPAAYNQGYRYKYVDNDGTTYYYDGTIFNWSAVATMNNSSLYRISWKEQIANPVKPEP